MGTYLGNRWLRLRFTRRGVRWGSARAGCACIPEVSAATA